MSARKVLIVEDDLADVYLLERTLRQHGVQNLDSVMTGEQAANYITGLSSFAERLLPELIFMDLKMTGMDGFQLITWFKRDPLLREIPLVVFSASTDPADQEKAMKLGASAFFQKTMEAAKLNTIVESALSLGPGS